MLFESERALARQALDAFKARAGAAGAALLHVDGVALTPWDGGPQDSSLVAALAAAGFWANLEVAKLLLAAGLERVRLDAGDEAVVVEALSRATLIVVLHDRARSSDDAVTAHVDALRDALRPILERLDARGGEDPGGRLAPLRPGDPPRPRRPRRDAEGRA